MIKKIKGTYTESLKHIKIHDGDFAESEKDVADEIHHFKIKHSKNSN